MLRYIVPVLALSLAAGCSSHSSGGKAASGSGWNQWVCDSEAQVQWRYVDPSRSVVDLKLGEDDVVHHLEEEPGGSGAFYSDGLIGLSIKGDQGLVYWVESNDLIGRGCKAR